MEHKLKNHILVYLAGIIIIFLLISFISLSKSQNRFFHFSIVSQLTESALISESLLLMMSSEVPQLGNNLKENDIDMPDPSTLFFEFTSGITPNNFTSLLGVELPGMNAISNGARMGGIGSGTAMAIESPPPDFEKLLEEEAKENQPEQDENIQAKKNANVFIYHTHAWEAFLPLMNDTNKKPSNASSINNNENIVQVGSMLTKQLKKRGVTAIHDKTNVTASLHERGWNYNDSYKFSRQTLQEVTASNEKIDYFIDVHRDAQRKDATTATINGKKYAKLYFIVGTGHKNYEQNLAFANKMNGMINEKYPGLSKGIYKKSKSEGNGIYNQDISKRSVLVEFGGVDNTRSELKNSSEALAEIIQEHQQNALKVNSAK
ncbi:stage II sporulation protein P [Lentibacillus cibarius]|uniref:Stage II sporulation protein P n=1 Tax=Lentibacillus cibarius TaxID=2583219 RepID=A0A5S3QFZ0_9BACI|nr:stage II sporulation protein P [Lentibacillus cibarius]TMN20727.1 stage II sporulation protein P [Lentibacillus cibarius]